MYLLFIPTIPKLRRSVACFSIITKATAKNEIEIMEVFNKNPFCPQKTIDQIFQKLWNKTGQKNVWTNWLTEIQTNIWRLQQK